MRIQAGYLRPGNKKHKAKMSSPAASTLTHSLTHGAKDSTRKQKIIKHGVAALVASSFYLISLPIIQRKRLQAEILSSSTEQDDQSSVVKGAYNTKGSFYKFFILDSVSSLLVKRYLTKVEPIPAIISFTISYPQFLNYCKRVVGTTLNKSDSSLEVANVSAKDMYKHKAFLLGLLSSALSSAMASHVIQPMIQNFVSQKLESDPNLTEVISYVGARVLTRCLVAPLEILWKRRAMNQLMPTVCTDVSSSQTLNRSLKYAIWLIGEEFVLLGRFALYRACVKTLE